MREKVEEGLSPKDREPHYEFLDPAKLRLFRDGSGRLRMTIEGERSYLEVEAVRTFPMSDPDHYVGFLDNQSKVIGIVVELGRMDEESQRLVAESLERHYFVPTITRVYSMKEEFGAVYWDVETDRGRREFVVKGMRDAIQELDNGELLFPDVDGNRYRIVDWRQLDLRSQRLLERVV